MRGRDRVRKEGSEESGKGREVEVGEGVGEEEGDRQGSEMRKLQGGGGR